MRLSPIDPTRPYTLSGIAFGHFFLDRYEEGRRIAMEILQVFPHHQSFATYIINCVGAGDLGEAKSAAAQFLKFDPAFAFLGHPRSSQCSCCTIAKRSTPLYERLACPNDRAAPPCRHLLG